MIIHEARKWKEAFKRSLVDQGYTEDVLTARFDENACKHMKGDNKYYANTVTLEVTQAALLGNDKLENSCKCFIRYAIGIFTHPDPKKVANGEQMVNGGVECTAISGRNHENDKTCDASTCNKAMMKTNGKTIGLDDAVRAAVGKIRFQLTERHLEEAMRYRRSLRKMKAMKKALKKAE